MGFSVEDSGFVVTHALYKAALIFAVLRWFLCWAVRVRDMGFLLSSNYFSSSSSDVVASSSCSSSLVSSQIIRESLTLTTFGDIVEMLPESCDTCAVCLNRLRKRDMVRALRNCRHVFHSQCIDKWLDHDHDNHRTCPLCRAPLLTSYQSLSLSMATSSEPSWAVERLLYLFGDDLLI